MLPRKNLIPLRKEFSRIKREGKMYDSLSFGLLVSASRPRLDRPQAAFIVSKKISLKSVVRHEVKRKLADAVAPLLVRVPKSTELIFLAKRGAVESSKEEIQKEIEGLLRRGQILK